MPITTRCKFRLSGVRLMHGYVGKEYTFSAMYDDTIEEDRRFNKYTPSGEFKMIIDNPAVTPMFEGPDGKPFLGKDFYFDISPVPPLVPATSPDKAAQPA